MMRDLGAQALDGACCRILAAETEGETEGEGRSDHDTREERLDQGSGDAELRQGSDDREDPDGPLGDRACEVR